MTDEYKPVKCGRKGFCPTFEIADHTLCAGCADNLTAKYERRFPRAPPKPPEGCGECACCEEGHPERCTRRDDR